MVKTGLVSCLCLAATAAAAQPQISDKVVTEDRYPQRRVTFAGGVTGLPDLTYATINGYRRLTLDLYLPPGPMSGARPVVIYIHGGGWSGGSPRNAGTFEDWPEILASFAARGYVTASIEYRFSAEAPFPAALQDTKAAIRWLRANAAKYGILGRRTARRSRGGDVRHRRTRAAGRRRTRRPRRGRSSGAAAVGLRPGRRALVRRVQSRDVRRGAAPGDADGGRSWTRRRTGSASISRMHAVGMRRAGEGRDREYLCEGG
jgi:hypothetical protein